MTMPPIKITRRHRQGSPQAEAGYPVDGRDHSRLRCVRLDRRVRAGRHAEARSSTGINAEIKKILSDTEIAKRLDDLTFQVIADSPEALTERIRSEYAMWGDVVKTTSKPSTDGAVFQSNGAKRHCHQMSLMQPRKPRLHQA